VQARSLRKIFLGAVAAAGCGGATAVTSDPIAAPYERPFACKEGFEQLRVATGVDYLEERQAFPGSPANTFTTLSANGVKCASARDKKACEASLAGLVAGDSLFAQCGGCAQVNTYLAITRGDEVFDVSNRGELLQLVGTTDTFADAWIVAAQAGYSPKCDEAGWIRRVDGGFEVLATKLLSDCPIQYADVRVRVGADGSIVELESKPRPQTGACAGRRPEGLLAARAPRTASAVGARFAQMARLERASVTAFEVLRDELVAQGAPARLVRSATRARRDELRHARSVGALARRFGADVERPRVAKAGARSLREIAIENAVEGCVRETWGALEATWQARAASDPRVAATMARIAEDETHHAALAWQVAAWAEQKLSARDRRAVRRAREAAVRSLKRELAAEPHASLVRVAGAPNAARARALLAVLERSLWS
jgi:hypothetical protein